MKVGTDAVLLGAWAKGGDRILDIGTGTGILSLMMAQRFGNSSVVAIDLDAEAVGQARENVAQSPFAHRISVLQQAVQQHVGQYDAIVCNPPYFADSLKTPDAQRTMARHAVTLTFAELMQAVCRLLDVEGEMSVVIPFDYRKRLVDEAIFAGLFLCSECAIHTRSGAPARRYLLSFRKHLCGCDSMEITLGDDEYERLTRDFYL